MKGSAVQCSAVQFRAVLLSIVQYSAVQCSTVQCSGQYMLAIGEKSGACRLGTQQMVAK